MHTAEEKRMVGEERIGIPPQGLVDGRSHGIDREDDAAQRKVVSPSHQADPVPILCLSNWPQ